MNIPIKVEVNKESVNRFLDDIELVTDNIGKAKMDIAAVKNFVDSMPQRIVTETDKHGIVTISFKPWNHDLNRIAEGA